MMNRLLTLILAAGALHTSFMFADDPEPYASIRLVPHESYYLENPYIITDKVALHPEAVFVDVSSKDGAAARWVASNTSDSVKIYSISKWTDSKNCFHKFLSNVRQENIATRVIPIRMGSHEAAVSLHLTADVIYLESENVSDLHERITQWSMHLSDDGVIIGNRFDIAEVAVAVAQAASELGLSLQINGHTWVLERS